MAAINMREMADAMQSFASLGMDKDTMDQFMDDSKEYALRPDWSCVRGPPKLNPDGPGMRYGASMEMRPQLLILPCPCAGGTRNASQVNLEGAFDGSNGLWSSWSPRVPSVETAANSSLEGETKESASDLPKMQVQSASSFLASILRHQRVDSTAFAGYSASSAAKKALGRPLPYHPGGEPYAADYRCGDHIKKNGSAWTPGARWWNTPAYGTVVVATPCPCAWGPYTGLNNGGSKASSIPSPNPAAQALSPSPRPVRNIGEPLAAIVGDVDSKEEDDPSYDLDLSTGQAESGDSDWTPNRNVAAAGWEAESPPLQQVAPWQRSALATVHPLSVVFLPTTPRSIPKQRCSERWAPAAVLGKSFL
mmetsp:Transcript_25922/g.56290  ORF Transcript_25922/g.56290 Transcript_25922/m.56290 type:complete len:364 (+) Transcript_25922:210-1301(+)|eukprot:CAMPEP_0206493124 /NCGR_PEP_ID=MMETSP0324_2-20121206/46706_1 /ASSEMBLY_ACC=CAM_ASM_000836 /TAXON_ID=2866 /ORGANISM="Crypthecodinium cohnii, Strain Seligo" /LENGTH=363 /DNA_ID=CAMNT_0053976049 /DNA_START=172 /DNA_END=1263 /DNA_ORIENTATION=+